MKYGGKVSECGGYDVVGKENKFFKPEGGKLGEHLPLAWNGGGQDAVKGGDAIGGDEKQVFAKVVNIADLAGGDFGNARKFRSVEEHE